MGRRLGQAYNQLQHHLRFNASLVHVLFDGRVDWHDDGGHELQWRGQNPLLQPKRTNSNILYRFLLLREHGDHELVHRDDSLQLQEDQAEGDRGKRDDGVGETLAQDQSPNSPAVATPERKVTRELHQETVLFVLH